VNQSTVIVGAVFAAFFIYITVRGELPVYAGLLLFSPPGGSSATAPNGGSSAQPAGKGAQQQTQADSSQMISEAIQLGTALAA